jgi:hypothetical protein
VDENVSSAHRPIVVPANNAEGIRQAFKQLDHIDVLGWSLSYAWRVDAMYLRARRSGPAVSYFLPKQPHVLMRLDAYTGELVGVDLLNYRRILARWDPRLRSILAGYLAVRLIEKLPLLKPFAQRQTAKAAKKVTAETEKYCPTC